MMTLLQEKSINRNQTLTKNDEIGKNERFSWKLFQDKFLLSPIVSIDFVNNIKGFSGDEGGGITLYSCLTPNHIDNLLESPNKLDILSQKKRD